MRDVGREQLIQNQSMLRTTADQDMSAMQDEVVTKCPRCDAKAKSKEDKCTVL